MPRKKALVEPAAETTTTAGLLNDPYEWIAKQTSIETSKDVEVPARLIEQVIGQDLAVAVATKAAQQKRHLLLIGDPGTGKSMIAKAMAEVLPPEKLNDVLAYHNAKDPNNPKILSVEAGDGQKVIRETRRRARRKKIVNRTMEWTLILGTIALGLYYFLDRQDFQALMFSILVALFMVMIFKGRKDPVLFAVPKLLMGHNPKGEAHAPYVDGTGSHAGALLGDVRHDPFQSGGLETPPHDRVEVGAIHRSHKGILFLDEINVLRLDSQQSLLTALQDREYAIVGQSQTSSGAMVRTDSVPCDFILVAAGNLDAVAPPGENLSGGMHPALRSRIRGYGYEVYVNNKMADTHENRMKIVRFVAQEVKKDGRIPHFERDAIAEVLLEAQRRSGQRGKLTLRLRELGGLVRTAGDIAVGAGRSAVTSEDVRQAKRLSRSLEQQIADSELEGRRSHESVQPEGQLMGLAHGVGLVGTGEVGEPAGLVIPVAAVVTSPLSRSGGHLAFGGGIEVSAKSQTETLAALLKGLAGDAVANHDMHIQSLVPQEGVDAEGAGAAMAVAVVSALVEVPVRQDTIIVGKITVSGELRAVRGVTQKIEAAIDSGYVRAIVPATNRSDVLLNPTYRSKVAIEYADHLIDVLDLVLVGPKKNEVVSRLGKAYSQSRRHSNGKTVPAAAKKQGGKQA